MTIISPVNHIFLSTVSLPAVTVTLNKNFVLQKVLAWHSSTFMFILSTSLIHYHSVSHPATDRLLTFSQIFLPYSHLKKVLISCSVPLKEVLMGLLIVKNVPSIHNRVLVNTVPKYCPPESSMKTLVSSIILFVSSVGS
jgi:hypothetical protein